MRGQLINKVENPPRGVSFGSSIIPWVLIGAALGCYGCQRQRPAPELISNISGEASTLAGSWNGDAIGDEIPFKTSLQLFKEGAIWHGTLRAYSWRRDVSLVQRANDDSSRVVFELKDVGAREGPFQLECRLDPLNNKLLGALRRGAHVTHLKLDRTQADLIRPPRWKLLPYQFEEREVSYEAGAVRISGTLSFPKQIVPNAAVLLLHGSNGGNRDASVGRRRYFATLAQFLSRSGIAVLRTDARGYGGSSGKHEAATLDELAADAEAGVAFIREYFRANVITVGLIGVSQGGLVAELCAVKSKLPSFVILLSTAALAGSDVAEDQVANEFRANYGFTKHDIELLEKLDRRMMDLAFTPRSPQESGALLRSLSRLYTVSEDPADVRRTEEDFRKEVDRLRQPALRSYLTYDPYETLRALRCAVLSINGSEDDVILPDKSVSRAMKALKDNREATVLKWPGLDHYLSCSWTGPALEGWDRGASYSPEILDYLAKWIVKRTSVEVPRPVCEWQ
jgi:pimeloyl-ACP methyl ester carboxylesterase